jgi:preprotein translocase subunit SecF
MTTTSDVRPVEPKRRRHTFADLYHERTHFQFVERSWRWAILSGVAIVISLVALGVNGLNLGIDFEGGIAWQFTVTDGSPSSGEVRDVLRPLGLADAKVQILGSDSVRIQAEDLKRADQDSVTDALAEYGGVSVREVSVNEVGPTWGEQVTEKAIRALIAFFILIAGYLSLRLEWKMALAAIVAVVHDIIITAGVYAVTGFEVTPATVVAFLTILGFSLYDTVVVFDKVKENVPLLGSVRGDTYSTMVNRSLNQVLMRSLNTSFVALLPVGSLLVVGSWILGAVGLRDFALALFVGLITGAYSSIFIATPILAWLKEREPRYRAVRERSAVDLARAATRPAPARPGPVDEPLELEVEPEVEPDAARRVAPKAAPVPARPSRPTPPSARPTPRPRQPRRRKRR